MPRQIWGKTMVSPEELNCPTHASKKEKDMVNSNSYFRSTLHKIAKQLMVRKLADKQNCLVGYSSKVYILSLAQDLKSLLLDPFILPK